MMTKHVPHKFVKDHNEPVEVISDFMTTEILDIDAEAPVKEAGKIMNDRHVGSLLVKEQGEYSGIITETDLTRKVIGQGLNVETTKVKEIMTSPVISIDCKERATDANHFMAKNNIRHLGVTENGKIVGVISVRDLVHYFSNPRLRTW